MYFQRIAATLLLSALTLTVSPAATLAGGVHSQDRAVPHYDHVFVIIEENHGYNAILHGGNAPNLTRLAGAYGQATQFFAVRHPSEPNYVAFFSGSTQGFDDDGAFTVNSVDAPNLATQLAAQGLSWGGYFGGYDPAKPLEVRNAAGYASKHNPFPNFSNLRSQPGFAAHQKPIAQLSEDLQNGRVPNFTLIVPGLCDDMHGMSGCDEDLAKTRRGDETAGQIVELIQNSPLWKSEKNVAIVITFDENDSASRKSGAQTCCGTTPGGGRIPTIVITNHGVRQKADATPYNLYSLLRTLEDAFGIYAYLGHAGDWDAGIRPMTPLFASGSTAFVH